MDSVERQHEILTLLQTQPAVKTRDLCQAFAVTRETIRKDLAELANSGLVIKVHGGATRSPNQESAYDRRKTQQTAAKQAIAREAVSMVAEHSTLYLDYGTTTFMLAAQLQARDPDLSIVSCALPIVSMLLTCKRVSLVVPGGLVRKNECSLYGPLTQKALETLYFDVGFFGCAGIHPRAGITNHHPLETAISTMVMERCRRVILLADHTKANRIAANKTAALDAIDDLIIDAAPDEDLATALVQARCNVTVAKN